MLERVRSAQRNPQNKTSLTAKQYSTLLNTTLDTSLTNLSELPSLTKPATSRKTDQIMSFDLNDILNPTSTLIDDDILLGEERANNESKSTNDIHSLLASTVTSTYSSVKPLSTLPPLLLHSKNPSSPIANDSNYEDDFEQPQGRFHNDEYSLGMEDLSNLSEEIDSDSYNEENIKLETPLLQTSDLLCNDNNIITSDEDLTPEEEDYNKMAETNYKKRKDKMEVEFKKKQVKPDDPGFVYDKEVNFAAPKMESGWDSGSTSDSEF